MFPATHDKYGLTDLFGSSNIVYWRPGLQYVVSRKLTMGTAYNDFWLANAHDALYIAGKAFASSPKGTAGTHIGQEADAQTTFVVNRATQLTAGYGHLFPGQFLQQTTKGMPCNIVFLNLAERF